MNELIQINEQSINDNIVPTINARELHGFLECGKDFSTWIKDRIQQYSFVEDQDYVVFEVAPPFRGAGNRGKRTDYHLTLDMSKELAMVERNLEEA